MAANLQVRPLYEEQAAQWDAFVQRNSQGTFYHETLWLNLLRRHIPDQDVCIYGGFDGERLAGGCAVRRRRSLALRCALKPWATHYNGVIVDDEAKDREGEIVKAIRHHLTKTFHVIQLVHAPRFECVSRRQEADCQFPERRTLIFPTDSPGAMWKRISHDARNSSKRARRAGVRVVESADVQVLSRLYWLSYQQQNVRIPFRPDQFESVCAGILNAGRGRMWLAVDKFNSPCAAVPVGWDDKRAYGLFSGTDKDRGQNGSGPLLWWEIFQALAPRFREVDMVGEGSPSIKRFKMQFNPTVVPVCEALVFRSPWSRWWWRSMERLRRAPAALRDWRTGRKDRAS
ncbi:MAG: GNAT family N-acetyltransferase [Candidatus Sumerlaeota bacterium]|nr:GNAT family N-acetyltransferase [Candidatus Sumerlaeota bacterium]